MSRVLAILVIALGLAACDSVNTVTEGFKQARAVENELQESTGLKPQVGFNWDCVAKRDWLLGWAGFDCWSASSILR